jgi:hypothetical protein
MVGAMRALWITLLVACHSSSGTAVDAHNPGISLSGTTSCEGVTCGSGQVCRDSLAFPDDGGIPTTCVDIPTTCAVFDCGLQGQPGCPACLLEQCTSCVPGSACGSLLGRELHCD